MRLVGPGTVVAVFAVAALGPGGALAGVPVKPRDVRELSNETTHTTFTEAESAAAITVSPAPDTRRITRLRFFTPDQEAVQTYLLLSEERIAGEEWVRLRVPMRPNGKIGWVPRAALGAFRVVHSEIVVNRETRQLRVYRLGKLVFEAPVGVGKPSTPTPPGHFWITESFPSDNPFYGPWAFGTSDYAHDTEFPDGSIVGLHGTDEPQLIPGDPSHGCIRMLDEDVLSLKRYIGIGTPIRIL